MDTRIYILAGAFGVLLVAIVVFVAVVTRARQADRMLEAQVEIHDPALIRPRASIDTDLSGLKMAVTSKADVTSPVGPARPGSDNPVEPPIWNDRPLSFAPIRPAEAQPVTVTEIEPMAATEIEPVMVADAEPIAVVEPEFSAATEHEPATVTEVEVIAVTEPEPVGEMEFEPMAMTEVEPVDAPASVVPVSAEFDDPDSDEAFSAEIAALLPALDDEVAEEPSPPAVERPRARVAASLDAITSAPTPVLEQPAAPALDVNDDDYHMVAPVEMWFGESRVGVKAGTATYDKFKKYADTLFEDLGDSAGSPT